MMMMMMICVLMLVFRCDAHLLWVSCCSVGLSCGRQECAGGEAIEETAFESAETVDDVGVFQAVGAKHTGAAVVGNILLGHDGMSWRVIRGE